MSTHKITPETKVPFPCWLNLRATGWNYYFGQVEADAQNFAQECATYYSTNPPDQPPLGEPAPEGHDWPNAHGRVVDAAGNAITSDPTPSAPCLQSVAEGVSKELVANLNAGFSAPGERLSLEALRGLWTLALARHFAPLLTERDERIGRLEAEIEALKANPFPLLLGRATEIICGREHSFEVCTNGTVDALTKDLTALRTRCEDLERDKERLDWLEVNLSEVRRRDPGPTMDNAPVRFSVWTPEEGRTDRFTSLRAAIDAARNQQEKA